MHEFVFFDQGISRADEALVAAFSQAALYGKGVFTTIAIYDGVPFLWDKSWRRLCNNAETVRIDFSDFSELGVRASLDDLVCVNAVRNGRVRITLLDISSGSIWPFATDRKAGLFVTTADFRPSPDNCCLATSPFPVNSLSPLSSIKSCNYLENLMAMDEAKGRGFDEAIRLNERGEVTSAVMANVFWSKDDNLFTPSLKTGCLPGTTREFVLENLECREVVATLDDLRSTDAIFLTSAGLGVVRVAGFDGRRMSSAGHQIVELIPKGI